MSFVRDGLYGVYLVATIMLLTFIPVFLARIFLLPRMFPEKCPAEISVAIIWGIIGDLVVCLGAWFLLPYVGGWGLFLAIMLGIWVASLILMILIWQTSTQKS